MRFFLSIPLVLAVLCNAALALAQVERVETDITVQKLVLTRNDAAALALSGDGDRLVMIDLASGASRTLLDAGERGLNERYSDFSIDRFRSDGGIVFVAGVRGRGFGEGIILQIDMQTGEVRSLLLIDQVITPSIVAGNDFVFFADVTSSVVAVVDRSDFEGAGGLNTVNRKSSYWRNIFIRGGAARRLAIDPIGNVLLVSHFGENRVSAFDALRGEQMLTFSLGRESSSAPLLIGDAVRSAADADLTLPFITQRDVGIVDTRFFGGRVFNDIKSVPHLFALPDSDPEVFDQRTAIAASANGNLLVALDVDFGELLALSVRRDRSRTRAPKITKSELREALGEVTLSTNLLIVSRTQLPEPADTLALSSNGEVLLMASRNHSTLTIIRNFGEWIQASETAKREVVAVIDSPSDETGSEQVTPYQNTAESALATDEVTFSALVQSFDGERSPTRGSPSVWVDQKALDILSYPVGEVDGLIGPQTRDAVRLFSTAAGITVVEYPSPEISGELRRSVKEKHAERMILRALDQDRIYKGDDDLRDTFESLEGHCERLPVDELCISQRSRGAGGSLDRGRSFLVEERFCEGSKPRRVQIDTYVFLGSRGDYFCSRDVSCATIQFDVPDGFRTVCLPNG